MRHFQIHSRLVLVVRCGGGGSSEASFFVVFGRGRGAALTRGELHEDAVHGEAGEPLGDEVHEVRHVHILPRPHVPS